MRKKWYLEICEKNHAPYIAKEVDHFSDIRDACKILKADQFVRVGVPECATSAELRELQTFQIEQI